MNKNTYQIQLLTIPKTNTWATLVQFQADDLCDADDNFANYIKAMGKKEKTYRLVVLTPLHEIDT
jgi:hypothetical protein